MSERLRIAIQKKGRIGEGCYELLKQCGLKFSVRGDGLLVRVRNMPIDLLLVRDDDIPSFVISGAADLGIVGENVLVEELLSSGNDVDIPIARRLGFSHCRLSLASSASSGIMSVSDLEGKKIATTYPGIVKRFLKKQGVNAVCIEMKGAVELAPRIGVANAICDLVSSGATLEANGLSAFETIFESEAVLVQSPQKFSTDKQQTYDRLVKRIDGVTRSQGSKYIMLNAPRTQIETISEILPGSDAPTVIPLPGKDDLVAIQAVCTETVFWETLEALDEAGARSILVVPIEKMMG